MSKPLKTILIIFVVLVLVLAGAVAAILILVDPNEYKTEISELVREKSGREISLKGDIELSLFPWAGVQIHNVDMAGTGTGPEALLHVERVKVHARLLPLLQTRIETDAIVLSGLDVKLHRDANGRANWTTDDTTAPAGTASAEAPAIVLPQVLAGLSIQGINIEDGKIALRDEQAGQHFELENLTLTTGTIEPGRPVAMDLSFDLHDRAQSSDGTVKFSGELLLDMDRQQVSVKDMAFDLGFAGKALDGGKLQTSLRGGVNFDAGKQLLALTDLVLDAKLERKDLPGGFMHTKLASQALLKMKENRLELSKLLLELSGLGKLEGHINVARLGSERPALQFKLHSDSLDVSPWAKQGPAPAGQAKVDPAQGTKPAAPAPLPVAALGAVDLDGSLSIEQFKAGEIQVSAILATVKGEGGKISLKPLQAKLYQGDYQGEIHLDGRPRPEKDLRVSMKQTIAHVQLQPLLKATTGKDNLGGTANVNVDLQGQGRDSNDIKATLKGFIHADIKNGELVGINIAHMIRSAYAQYKGLPAPPDEPQKTDFSEMRAKFDAADGVLTSREFYASSPLLRVDGTGKVNLLKEKINYKLTTALVKSLKGQDGEPIKELEHVTLPIRIKGGFAEPEISLDMDAILQKAVETQLEKHLLRALEGDDEKKKRKAEKRNKNKNKKKGDEEKVDDFLKGLLGG